MTRCLDCTHLDLRAFPAHAKVGYGRCAKQTAPGVFESIVIARECMQFAAADPDVVANRATWWEKQ